MQQIIDSATNKAVQELKSMINDARVSLIETLTEKVGKLTHSEEREVLKLVYSPTGEDQTVFVKKRTGLIIDKLVEEAAKPAKKRGRPAKEKGDEATSNNQSEGDS